MDKKLEQFLKEIVIPEVSPIKESYFGLVTFDREIFEAAVFEKKEHTGFDVLFALRKPNGEFDRNSQIVEVSSRVEYVGLPKDYKFVGWLIDLLKNVHV